MLDCFQNFRPPNERSDTKLTQVRLIMVCYRRYKNLRKRFSRPIPSTTRTPLLTSFVKLFQDVVPGRSPSRARRWLVRLIRRTATHSDTSPVSRPPLADAYRRLRHHSACAHPSLKLRMTNSLQWTQCFFNNYTSTSLPTALYAEGADKPYRDILYANTMLFIIWLLCDFRL